MLHYAYTSAGFPFLHHKAVHPPSHQVHTAIIHCIEWWENAYENGFMASAFVKTNKEYYKAMAFFVYPFDNTSFAVSGKLGPRKPV